MRGHVAILSLLLSIPQQVGDFVADVSPNLSGNVWDLFGTMPIIAAARNGHEHAVRTLLLADSFSLQYRDAMGRGLLWWANRSGNMDLVALILGYAEMCGIIFQDGDLSKEQEIFQVQNSGCWCDVCTRHSVHYTKTYCCQRCDGMLICRQCVDTGAQCRDASHRVTWAVFTCPGGHSIT